MYITGPFKLQVTAFHDEWASGGVRHHQQLPGQLLWGGEAGQVRAELEPQAGAPPTRIFDEGGGPGLASVCIGPTGKTRLGFTSFMRISMANR